jgi:hypothetical protein
MKKGAGVLPIPIKAIMILAIIVILLVVLFWRLSLFLTNPCWEEAMNNLRPIEESIARNLKTTLVLNSECVKKVVFTTSRDVCQDTCEEYMTHDVENDQRRECIQKCNVQPSLTKTFVIALPTERAGISGSGKKLSDFINKGEFKWLFDGKVMVFSFKCQLIDIRIHGQDCIETGESWICTPPKQSSSRYEITIEQLGEQTCRIVPYS